MPHPRRREPFQGWDGAWVDSLLSKEPLAFPSLVLTGFPLCTCCWFNLCLWTKRDSKCSHLPFPQLPNGPLGSKTIARVCKTMSFIYGPTFNCTTVSYSINPSQQYTLFNASLYSHSRGKWATVSIFLHLNLHVTKAQSHFKEEKQVLALTFQDCCSCSSHKHSAMALVDNTQWGWALVCAVPNCSAPKSQLPFSELMVFDYSGSHQTQVKCLRGKTNKSSSLSLEHSCQVQVRTFIFSHLVFCGKCGDAWEFWATLKVQGQPGIHREILS
jgi:hypothetical protein